MKPFLRLFTFLLLGILIPLLAYSDPIKVAYATGNVIMAPNATSPDNDPIVQMLLNDKNFSVNVLLLNGDETVDLTEYDIAIVQESISSGSSILNPSGSLGLANIPIPFLYNKIFALRDGRAFESYTRGNPINELGSKVLYVAPSNQSNPIFNGIDIINNRFTVLKNNAGYRARPGEYGLQYNGEDIISTINTLVSFPEKVTNAKVCINDIPAGSTVGSETIKARMLTMGMQFGAMCVDSGFNITGEGLTLWRNAIYSLAGLEIPKTLVFSETKTDQLPQVKNIQATNKEFSVELAWPYAYTQYIDKFEIWRGTHTTNMVKIGETTDLTFTDNDVSVGDEFYYSIIIRGSRNDGLASDEIHVVVSALAPQSPEITFYECFNKTNYLEWIAPEAQDILRYRIYRGLSKNSIMLFDSLPPQKTSYVDYAVLNETQYYYYVTAVDKSLNESPKSEIIMLQPYNGGPNIQKFEDYVAHDIQDNSVTMPFTLDKSYDSDFGELTGFYWYINGNKVSGARNPILQFNHGTNHVKVIIEDNDGAQDSTTFTVSVDAGYYTFTPNPNENAGISGISDNYIYVPTSDGKMQILDGNFNEVLNVSVPGDIRSVSSISTDTMLYLSSSAKTIFCFDKLGIPQWSVPLGGDLQATPTIDIKRNRIYAGVSNNNFFAINRNTGKVDWIHQTKSPVELSGVILGSDTLLVTTRDGEVLLFHLDAPVVDSKMEPVARFNLDTSPSSVPAVDKHGNMYIAAIYGQFIKFHFDKTTGQEEIDWNKNYNIRYPVAPSIGSDGTLYVGTEESTLCAINPENGSTIWSVQLDGPITSTATINYFDRIYVGTENGTMYGIGDEGHIFWKYETHSPIANASIYENNHLYFSNASGDLYKIQDPEIRIEILGSKSAQLTELPQWGTYMGNSRRSGMQAEALGILVANKSIVANTLEVSSYPNPFKESFVLQFNQEMEGDIQVKIYNTQGQLVKSMISVPNLGNQSIEISLKEVPTGVYFYQITSNGNSSNGKIVKQ